MATYIVEVREATTPAGEPEIYEVDAPTPEEAIYTAKDWYENDFHAHDIDKDTGLVAVARPKENAS